MTAFTFGMVYACDACKYLFEAENEVDQCPDCGKHSVRQTDFYNAPMYFHSAFLPSGKNLRFRDGSQYLLFLYITPNSFLMESKIMSAPPTQMSFISTSLKVALIFKTMLQKTFVYRNSAHRSSSGRWALRYVFNYSFITSSIILAPSLKLSWNNRQSAMV